MSSPYCDFLSSVVVSNVAKCLRMFMDDVVCYACRWKCGWLCKLVAVVEL